MSKTTDQLVRIAAAGGGVIVDGKNTTDQLVRVAAAAAHSGATVVIKNANSKTTDQLVQIGAAGKGRVVFDLTE